MDFGSVDDPGLCCAHGPPWGTLHRGPVSKVRNLAAVNRNPDVRIAPRLVCRKMRRAGDGWCPALSALQPNPAARDAGRVAFTRLRGTGQRTGSAMAVKPAPVCLWRVRERRTLPSSPWLRQRRCIRGRLAALAAAIEAGRAVTADELQATRSTPGPASLPPMPRPARWECLVEGRCRTRISSPAAPPASCPESHGPPGRRCIAPGCRRGDGKRLREPGRAGSRGSNNRQRHARNISRFGTIRHGCIFIARYCLNSFDPTLSQSP